MRPFLRRMEKRNHHGVYFILKSMEQGPSWSCLDLFEKLSLATSGEITPIEKAHLGVSSQELSSNRVPLFVREKVSCHSGCGEKSWEATCHGVYQKPRAISVQPPSRER